MNKLVGIGVGILLGVITIGGDLLVKEASLHQSFAGWKWLLTGAIIYGVTVLGWFYVMRKVDLPVVGAVYSVATVIALTFLGTFVYREKLSSGEVVGLTMAVGSLVILFRFA